MRAYVLVKVRGGGSGCGQGLRQIEGIVEAHMTLGPYDAVAVVETSDVAKLGAITAAQIQPISGVERTLTCLTVDF